MGSLILIFAATWAFVLSCLQPYSPLDVTIAFAIGSLLWAIFGLLALRSRAASGRLFAARRILAMVLLTWGGLEVGLEVWAHLFPAPIFSRSGCSPQSQVENARREPGSFHMGFPVASDGYYDEEWRRSASGPLTIVIADSFAWAAVPHGWHYTSQAEIALNTDGIVNVGFPGIGPREYLWLIENEEVAKAATTIVVAFFMGNDLSDLWEREENGDLLHRLFDANQHLTLILPPRIWRIRSEAKAVKNWLAQGSGGKLDSRGTIEAYPHLREPALELPTMSQEKFLSLEANRVAFLMEPPESVWPMLRQTFRRMDKASGSAKFAVMIIPDEFEVDDGLWAALEKRVVGGLNSDRWAARQRVVAVLQDLGIPFVDLHPELRAATSENAEDKHVYHLQDTHLNARGHHIAGLALARLLRRLGD